MVVSLLVSLRKLGPVLRKMCACDSEWPARGWMQISQAYENAFVQQDSQFTFLSHVQPVPEGTQKK